jgi:hypothetical protein
LLRDCSGADSVSEDAGRIPPAAGRLAVRLVDLREAGRDDFGAADRGRDDVDLGLAAVARRAELCGFAAARAVDAAVPGVAELALAADPAGLAALDEAVRDEPARAEPARAEPARAEPARAEVLRVDEALADDVRDDGRVDDVLRDDGRVDDVLRAAGLRALVVRDAVARRAGLAATGLASDIVLAAAVSAFAAVIMALVAVFIDLMACDIVCAEVVALLAAAVILVAAVVTLVAAEVTFLAAVAGVAELRLLRLVVLLRAVPEREAVERDAVARDAVPRVDREAVLRVVALAAVPLAGFAALLRAVLGLALDVLELELDGRLAVPPLDALRLTDLLRAVLAELRRVAARVVD